MTVDLRMLLTFALGAPLVAGLLSLITQLSVVRDRRSRTGDGWDARDTFEIKDAILGAVTWLSPMGVMFVSFDWMKTLSTWQWWVAFLAITLPLIPFSIWYGRWSVATRKAFEDAAATKRGEQPTP